MACLLLNATTDPAKFQPFLLQDSLPLPWMHPEAQTGAVVFFPSELLDLLIGALPFAMTFFVCRVVGKRYLFHFVASALNVPRKRREKFGYQLWLFLFYTVSTIFGAVTLRDRGYFTFPLDHESKVRMVNPSLCRPDASMKLYYRYEIGFFFAELVAIFVETRRKDFLEYVIHHTITIIMMAGSMGDRNHDIGAYTLFLHDISDIFLCLAKVAHYARLETITNISFGIFAASFAYLRLYCLPIVTFVCWLYLPRAHAVSIGLWFQTCLMSVVLQGLHTFWFYLIIRMTYRLVAGVKGDVRSDDEQ